MEVIRTVQACEQIGINAVFLTFEEHPDNGSPLLEPLPEARAIITTGWGRNELMSESSIPEYDKPLPAVDKVIGRQSIMANQNAPVWASRIRTLSYVRTCGWTVTVPLRGARSTINIQGKQLNISMKGEGS